MNLLAYTSGLPSPDKLLILLNGLNKTYDKFSSQKSAASPRKRWKDQNSWRWNKSGWLMPCSCCCWLQVNVYFRNDHKIRATPSKSHKCWVTLLNNQPRLLITLQVVEAPSLYGAVWKGTCTKFRGTSDPLTALLFVAGYNAVVSHRHFALTTGMWRV